MSTKNKLRLILLIVSLMLCVGSCLVIDDARIFLGMVMFVCGSNIASEGGRL